MENEVVETKAQEALVTDTIKEEKKPQEESQEQINWKKFREAREKERKEKEAAERELAKKAEEVAALKAAMEAIVNPPKREYAEPEEQEETEDDRIKRQVEAALADQRRKDEQDRAERERKDLPKALATTYSDFDHVCSSENLDYLEFHYPEITLPYRNMPDNFDKWSAIYRAVKRFVPNVDSKDINKKIERNAMKPQSMSSAVVNQSKDVPPLIVDDQRRADNWARMQRIIKGGK